MISRLSIKWESGKSVGVCSVDKFEDSPLRLIEESNKFRVEQSENIFRIKGLNGKTVPELDKEQTQLLKAMAHSRFLALNNKEEDFIWLGL